mmetsp:Transcript_10633/g.25787  ORF Transcript_10633/g.25787 Transcript_10633/m.25787 type:complete len:203 (-) Transcript_10633:678-1286(-)
MAGCLLFAVGGPRLPVLLDEVAHPPCPVLAAIIRHVRVDITVVYQHTHAFAEHLVVVGAHIRLGRPVVVAPSVMLLPCDVQTDVQCRLDSVVVEPCNGCPLATTHVIVERPTDKLRCAVVVAAAPRQPPQVMAADALVIQIVHIEPSEFAAHLFDGPSAWLVGGPRACPQLLAAHPLDLPVRLGRELTVAEEELHIPVHVVG